MEEEILCCWKNWGHVLKRWPHSQHHPFPKKGKPKRETDTQCDWQEGEGVSSNILFLTETFIIWLLYVRKKNPFRNLSMHTFAESDPNHENASSSKCIPSCQSFLLQRQSLTVSSLLNSSLHSYSNFNPNVFHKSSHTDTQIIHTPV